MRKAWLRAVPLASLALLTAGGSASAAGSGPLPARAAQASPVSRAPVTAAGRGGETAEAWTGDRAPAVTLLATADGTIPAFAAPGGKQTGEVPATWHSAPSTLPVIATSNGWLKVRLAQRPNESSTWVRAQNVTVSSTPYSVVIDLATTSLTLYQDGVRVMSVPAGVGTSADPTPTGEFFVAFMAKAPSPGYGAFVLVTSAHSDAITDWEMSGDAMVAIHGPLGGDQLIGSSGARISHGCIRLHESDLLRLSDLPAGTPVTIVS